MLLVTLAMPFLASCGVNRWEEYYPLTQRDMWIDSLMREEYLWYKDIPSSENLNYFSEPATFLNSLLSSLDDGYSRIDSLYDVPETGYGFDYTLYSIADNDTAYNALVTYIIPGSPAEEAGLKRGEWIMMVDNEYITKKNETILTEGTAKKLLVGTYGETTDEEGETVGFIKADRETQLPATRDVQDKDIPVCQVLEQNGKHIGYMLYNTFSPDNADEVKQYAQQFKDNNVSDVVLDLRYNAGGDMESVELMAAILAPANQMGNALAQLKYSDKKSAKDRTLTLDESLLQGTANLGLKRLYVLTSTTTAGASEMLINCLKPYMDVFIVGEKTKGQTVATEPFCSQKHSYCLRPVVCEVFNAQGTADYASGFTPDEQASSLSNLATVLPFGDPNETLLAKAIALINGETTSDENVQTRLSRNMTAVKHVNTRRHFSTGLRMN